MKRLIALGLLAFSGATFAADRLVDYVQTNTPCPIEGERVYTTNGEDHDVFECQKGVWKFLYTRVPGEQ